MAEAGFENIQIRARQSSREFIQADFGEGKFDDHIASADVTAFKPIS